MFGSVEKKKGGDVAGFIGKSISIEGRLSFSETVRIEGSFKGEVSSDGTLVVGEGGYVEGDIKVGSAVITGTVKGTLEASERVELRAPGSMSGEIKTPTLIIDEGVVFEGTCTMVKKQGAAPYETVQYGSAEEGPAQ